MELDLNLPSSASAPVQAPPAVTSDAKPQRTDKHIWGVYMFLVIISLIELYSASSREVTSSAFGVLGPLMRHGSMLLAGFFIMLGLQKMHYRVVYAITPISVFVAIMMMIYVLVAGEEINGAKRAFTFIVTIQPSEFLKLTAAMIIAYIMSRNQLKDGRVRDRAIWISAAVVGFYGLLLITQGLTNTLLLMAISLSMLVIGGISWRQVWNLLMAFVVVGIVVLGVSVLLTSAMPSSGDAEPVELAEGEVVKEEGIMGRINTWVARMDRFHSDGRPKYELEINAKNRQEMYAFMAQANGGLFGVGPGNSRETSRLPLAFSDYIYSIIVEEWGLVGGMFTLLLYLWLLCRAAAIAGSCARAFPALLVIGMAVMIGYQALFHMAIVTGVFPVSGQPLPLISKGGTSILVTSIALGIMLSVSRHAVRTGSKKQEIKDEISELPEEIRGENLTSFN
ncbi:MAG: FtsW/RodA/SpoVE family cell cycle protein [Paramuribaculum sp.]|nr:FtsW/RodA/SpoVE family cell cycle protein [Bacteroidales bacterium]MBD5243039.1 FtsW/RodA/SpoVE family cell cycle protein [Barnesiella sp.]MDE6249606.1 FtsW/RodA/SpoVE family cell cycle protein [Paramuribaculum sp.]MDE7448630.1 FtsW/RodA/SpoVE family cell cycle protein [Paramuribaculum sp.]